MAPQSTTRQPNGRTLSERDMPAATRSISIFCSERKHGNITTFFVDQSEKFFFFYKVMAFRKQGTNLGVYAKRDTYFT